MRDEIEMRVEMGERDEIKAYERYIKDIRVIYGTPMASHNKRDKRVIKSHEYENPCMGY